MWKGHCSCCVLVVWLIALLLPAYFIDNCACILDKELPPKPKLLAHRGSPGFGENPFPENTYKAYEDSLKKGALGIESDVQFSKDGVAFVMHDKTMLRTTDVAKKFPAKKTMKMTKFTSAEIDQIKAGDPWCNSRGDCKEPIPRFYDIINLTARYNASLIFDFKGEYRAKWYKGISDQVYDCYGAKASLVYLPEQVDHKLLPYYQENKALPDGTPINKSQVVKLTLGFSPAEGSDEMFLQKIGQLMRSTMDFKAINVPYLVSQNMVDLMHDSKVETMVYTIKWWWIFSAMWCKGVDWAIADPIWLFDKMDRPYINISRGGYIALCVCMDVMAVVVATILTLIYTRPRHGDLKKYYAYYFGHLTGDIAAFHHYIRAELNIETKKEMDEDVAATVLQAAVKGRATRLKLKMAGDVQVHGGSSSLLAVTKLASTGAQLTDAVDDIAEIQRSNDRLKAEQEEEQRLKEEKEKKKVMWG